jgi:hypothetical protein
MRVFFPAELLCIYCVSYRILWFERVAHNLLYCAVPAQKDRPVRTVYVYTVSCCTV